MEVQKTREGLIINIVAKPDSGRFGICLKGNDIVIELTSPPNNGRANQEILRKLPRITGCGVSILRGSRSKRKLLLLKGITRESLERILETR